MLTDKAIPLYRHISHACEASLGPELAANEMLKPGWENNRYVKEFLTRNTPGRKPAQGPLLLISGEADPEVPAASTATTVARLCKQKEITCFSSNIRTSMRAPLLEPQSASRSAGSGLDLPAILPPATVLELM